MNMQFENLDRYWDSEHGFFGLMRQGVFDADGFSDFLSEIRLLNLNKSGTVNAHLVSNLWFVPIFIEWQRERLIERGVDAKIIDRARNEIIEELIRILGVP